MATIDAVKYLETALADGPRKVSDILREARIYEIPLGALADARLVVGVYERWDHETATVYWE